MPEQADPQQSLGANSDSDWEVEHLRLTCFVQGASLSHQNWWERICGSSPESSTIRMKGVHQLDQGKYGSGVFVLEVQPGRIDLVLKPSIDEQNPIMGIPVLGLYPKGLIEFEGIANQWWRLNDLPPIHRIAFGVAVFMSVDSLKAGYLKLGSYLKELKIPDNSTDFSYQINKPRNALTKIPSLTLNRLSKWSVARLRIYGQQLGVLRTLAAERYACRLELNINTVPEHVGPLPTDLLPTLFSELTALASEIMLKGDIA